MGDYLVTVVQDGRLGNVEQAHLRKGDLVVVQAGEVVPADLKLVQAQELQVDEFDVTGEILPVTKKVGEDEDALLHMGSRITKGFGKGIVLATGEQAEYGKVLGQSGEQDASLEFHLFGIEYVWLVLLLLPAFVILVDRLQNPLLAFAAFLFGASVLIAAQNHELFRHWIISNEKRRLERQGIQIRDPLALERMHGIDTVCFDKTGVVTTRGLEVTNICYVGTSSRSDHLVKDSTTSEITLLACALCHDVLFPEKLELANPMDRALISFALKSGVNVYEELARYKRIYSMPFDSENRYMACGYQRDGQVTYLAKGDPSVIASMCRHYLTASGEKKAKDLQFLAQNRTHMDGIAQSGGTAIALAFASESPERAPAAYTYLALLDLDNPVRSGVKELVQSLSREGKRSILLTGDRRETAARVGVQCGIADDVNDLLTGKMIERMALDEVAKQSAYVSIFARLLPSQKGLVIRLLQQRNHSVAMVGDGPNDGIALKVSDVGISFVKDSSPIARRLAKILINDATQLLSLIQASNRIEARKKGFLCLRIFLVIGVFVGLYGWVLSSISSHP